METPIVQLNFPNDRGIRIFCKRDDLLPFSLGGNKVRIAQQFLRDMEEKGGDCMVVYGNKRSNLCRVLANLCSSKKIPCVMICSLENEEDEQGDTNNSLLMQWLFARVITCTKTTIAQTVESVMKMLEEEGYHPYYIFGDKYGQGNEGTPVQAYVDGYQEIHSWEMAHKVNFSHIFFASGTGATQSGLIAGKIMQQGSEKILGISISSREYERAVGICIKGIQDYFVKKGMEIPENLSDEVNLEMAYRAGGYGRYNDEIMHVIRQQFCMNGMALDPTYTGKAFWGMINYISDKNLSNCDVLFLHTGGTPLFYDCLSGGKQKS